MAMSRVAATIPFDEIVAGASVRFCVIDGVQYLSIRDLIKCVCGMTGKRACQVWDRIAQNTKDEVSSFCGIFQFPGQRQSSQPVITFVGALKLIMFLPGEAAKQHRSVMADILRRYFAGDMSLFDELANNARSDSPMAQMARESLAGEGGTGQIKDGPRKRKREEVELFKMEAEAKLKEAEAKCAVWSGLRGMVDSLTAIYANKDMDDDTKERLKEQMLESFATKKGPDTPVKAVIEYEPTPDSHESLFEVVTVLSICREMGLVLDEKELLRVDTELHKDFMRKYGKEAKERRMRLNGRDVYVHTYFAQDRQMIKEAIREWQDLY